MMGRPVLLKPGGDGRLPVLVAAVAVAGTFFAILFHFVVMNAFGAGYPWDTYLFNPRYRFSDFFDVYDQALAYGPGVSDNMVYSPFLHLVTCGLALLPRELAFALVILVFVATLAAVSWRWLSRTVTPLWARAAVACVMVVAPHPVAFVIDRGNLDMLVFVLLALFVYLYYERGSQFAWIPLALAVAGKYFWATLLVLLLADRQVRQALWAVVGAVLVTVVSALAVALTSGFGLGGVFSSLFGTLGGHVENAGVLYAVHFSHSLWGMVLVVDRWSDYALSEIPMLNTFYVVVVLIIFVWVAVYLVTKRYAPWRQLTALVVLTLLLPFESHDYTLVFLLLPLALFLATGSWDRASKVVAVLFALLLVPWHYYNFTFWDIQSDVAISVFIGPALLIGLLVVALRRPPAAPGRVAGAAGGVTAVVGDGEEA